ncbi:MAG TPA: isochorismatase family cysteine hydrolase [Rhizomicrobium sp.]|jgi:nicotinamidase-related amidase|nr:isochorismatase family cysteine hydrolase [Rhizomicrobium sp.]
MAVTTLDPKTALIVVDLQKGILSRVAADAISGVLKNAVALLDAFRKHKLPVVLVNVTGVASGRNEGPRMPGSFPAEFAELIPELKQQASDHTVTKRTWGAFTNTDLDAWLKKNGVTQVVVCGVASSAGVESTARFAQELGYNVTLATDAMTDMSPEAHENSIKRIFPRLGETGTTAEIVALLGATQ